jgi:site-specific recombinase XerD
MKIQIRSPQKSIKYLSEEETKLFFSIVKKNPRDHLLFRWMYLYGLRVSEATALRLSDLLPGPGRPREIFIKRLKGGIARHFPVRSEDSVILKRWLRKRERMKNAEGNPWLFITSHSSLYHMSSINVEKLMRKYGEQIGLPGDKHHPHVWRHSCAIHMLMNGADIYDVQSHLGHTSVTTTIQYYGQFGHKDWIAKTRDRLENRFFV